MFVEAHAARAPPWPTAMPKGHEGGGDQGGDDQGGDDQGGDDQGGDRAKANANVKAKEPAEDAGRSSLPGEL